MLFFKKDQYEIIMRWLRGADGKNHPDKVVEG